MIAGFSAILSGVYTNIAGSPDGLSPQLDTDTVFPAYTTVTPVANSPARRPEKYMAKMNVYANKSKNH